MERAAFPDEVTASTLQAVPDAVIAFDSQGVIRFVNLQTEALTGYSYAEIIGQQIEILGPTSRRSDEDAELDNFQTTPSLGEIGTSKSLVLRRRDGIIVPIAMSSKALLDSAENIVISIVRDVSEQERQSRENKLLAELGSVVEKARDIGTVYECLESSLPAMFQFDRFVVSIRVPGTDIVERASVCGKTLPDLGVGTKATYPDGSEASFGPLRQPQPTEANNSFVSCQSETGNAELPSWLRVPLGDSMNPSGCLILRSAALHAYNADDLSILERVATQVSPAIENARLNAQVRREAHERTVLASVSRIVTSRQNLHDVFGVLVDTVRELVPAERVYIRLLDEDETGFTDSYGWDGRGFERPLAKYTPVAGHPMEILVAGQSSININDHNKVEMSARYLAIRDMLEVGFESRASTALRYQDRVVGVVVIASREANAYSEREIRLLEEISAQIAGAIINSELAATLSLESERKHTLAEIGQAVCSTLDVCELLEGFATLAKNLIPFDLISYADFDPEMGIVTLRYCHGTELPLAAKDAYVESARSISENAAATGRAVLRTTDSNMRMSDQTLHTTLNPDRIIEEIICVPLTSRNAIFGCLYLGSNRLGVFTTEHLELANQLAAQVAGAFSNARSYEARLEAEKNRAESEARSRELKRLDEERSAFLSTVSHELRTPLTGVTAFADILLKNRESNLSERQLMQIRIMQRNARRLDVLIDDLLDVSKLDVGEFKLTKQSFDIKGLVDELRTAMGPVFKSKKQTLSVDFPPGQVQMFADRFRIAQVITNLLTNSSKYSHDEIEIALSISVEGDSLSITVEDRGIGMNAETLKKLFTPFFRSDDAFSQSEPGTGLGLTIVKSIVELHGGTLSVSSEEGVGTKLRVLVPIG
ncbi:MAG: GAF domain-containing protein [Dehalococcoidia bacterium]